MPIRRRKLSDLKLFNEFLNSDEEERNIENIPAAELQQLAKKFVLGVRKKNGEEYEPSSDALTDEEIVEFYRAGVLGNKP